MTPLLQKLLATSPVVLDGGWGTQLQARGLRPGESPDVWNLTHADDVYAVAAAYADAGSRVILTNTFGANRISLSREGFAGRVGEINRLGVELSKRGAAGRACVFGSIGPTGRMLMSGDVTGEEIRTAFSEQARAIAEAGADGIVVETMSDLAEAAIAVTAARSTGLPVVACMSFDSGKTMDRTLMGTTPEQAAVALVQAGTDVLGANCGQSIGGYLRLVERLRAATSLPLWIKPNAGSPELVDGQAVYRQTPTDFAGYIPGLVKAGAQFIGGCCGTTPEFIRAISHIL
jgi:5-methyltetrahydrofolate--homocysteine methyltransferase